MLLKPRIEQRGDEWWVAIDLDDLDDMGPYDTKKEATESQRGLLAFLRYEDTFGFVTGGDVL